MKKKTTYAGETFERWTITGNMLYSPEGDRFTPWMIRACHYLKQSREFSHLMHWRPAAVSDFTMLEYRQIVIDHHRSVGNGDEYRPQQD